MNDIRKALFLGLTFCLMTAVEVQAAQIPAESSLAFEQCHQVSAKLASVSLSECLQRGLEPTGSFSNNGQPILAKEYPPLPERRLPLGRVLLIGGIHGDEYSSISVAFKWMHILDRHHSGLFHWHVVPLMNPDGLLRAKSQRMNANGVDLNRNFYSPNWQHQAQQEWHRRKKNPRRYPGPKAVSEPETRWLTSEIESFRPDVIISIHAPYGVVDVDGPLDGPESLGRLQRRLLGNFPGSLGRFAGVLKEIPVITIELASAARMPSQRDVSAMWMDLVRWLRVNLKERDHWQARHDNQADPS